MNTFNGKKEMDPTKGVVLVRALAKVLQENNNVANQLVFLARTLDKTEKKNTLPYETHFLQKNPRRSCNSPL
jgi:hypothetical protein